MFFENLSKSWSAYSRNAVTMAIGSLLLVAVMLVSVLAFFMLSFSSPLSFLSLTYTAQENMKIAEPPFLAAGLLVLFVGVMAAMVIQVGIYGMASECLQKKTSLKTLIRTAKNRWYATVGAELIKWLLYVGIFAVSSVMIFVSEEAFTITMVLLLVLLWALLSLTYPAIAAGKGPVSAIKHSVRISKMHFTEVVPIVLFFSLISYMLNIAIAIPIIGSAISFFVITPWSSVAYTLIYKKYAKK